MTRAIYLTEEDFKLHLWWAFLSGSVYDSKNLVNREFYKWYDEYIKDFQDYSDIEDYRELLKACWQAAQEYEWSDHSVDALDFNEWYESKFGDTID